MSMICSAVCCWSEEEDTTVGTAPLSAAPEHPCEKDGMTTRSIEVQEGSHQLVPPLAAQECAGTTSASCSTVRSWTRGRVAGTSRALPRTAGRDPALGRDVQLSYLLPAPGLLLSPWGCVVAPLGQEHRDGQPFMPAGIGVTVAAASSRLPSRWHGKCDAHEGMCVCCVV